MGSGAQGSAQSRSQGCAAQRGVPPLHVLPISLSLCTHVRALDLLSAICGAPGAPCTHGSPVRRQHTRGRHWTHPILTAPSLTVAPAAGLRRIHVASKHRRGSGGSPGDRLKKSAPVSISVLYLAVWCTQFSPTRVVHIEPESYPGLKVDTAAVSAVRIRALAMVPLLASSTLPLSLWCSACSSHHA